MSDSFMLPLQILRIFDPPRPTSDQSPISTPRAASAPQNETSQTVAVVQEERRKAQDRRNNDRREKQQSTFLNTRKTQGRRHSPGRRATDQANKMDHRPISLKG